MALGYHRHGDFRRPFIILVYAQSHSSSRSTEGHICHGQRPRLHSGCNHAGSFLLGTSRSAHLVSKLHRRSQPAARSRSTRATYEAFALTVTQPELSRPSCSLLDAAEKKWADFRKGKPFGKPLAARRRQEKSLKWARNREIGEMGEICESR